VRSVPGSADPLTLYSSIMRKFKNIHLHPGVVPRVGRVPAVSSQLTSVGGIGRVLLLSEGLGVEADEHRIAPQGSSSDLHARVQRRQC
jgi:hypothetical protein